MKYFYALLCLAALLLTLTSCDVNVSTGTGNGGYSNGNGNGSYGSGTGSNGTKRERKSNGSGSYGSNGSGNYGSNGSSQQGQPIGQQTKTSGCQPQGGLPDRACTPGAIIPNATVNQICQSGYSSGVRNVPVSEKDQVYAEYGIQSHSPGEYEVDHLISLELGGSNDIANLWPEASSPKPGFHEKDQVENYLHSQVCSGAISLHDAQMQIATNWLNIYSQMSGGK
ncbi:MAG: hypothetical protein NVS2B12_11510 [Ktedonobacteraceae bacterium]